MNVDLKRGFKYFRKGKLNLRINEGFLIVLIAGPEKHVDFLPGPLSFRLLQSLYKKVAQNEVRISYLPG